MTQSKFNIGLVLSDELDKLRYDPDKDGDYELIGKITDGHNYSNLNTPDDVNNSLDAVIFMHYPFNKELAQEFSKKENESDIFFLNSSTGVLNTSEKTFEYFNFEKYMPDSLYIDKNTSNKDMADFFKSYNHVIVKPVNGTGGYGIKLHKKDEDIIDVMDNYKSGRYIAQEFIPNSGDKRILCLNGDILGYFGRFNESTYINNISAGGFLIDVDLSNEEIKMAEDISSKLVDKGVYFSGLDVIDGKLIEVNTACPGGINVAKPYKFKSQDKMYDFATKTVYDLLKK